MSSLAIGEAGVPKTGKKAAPVKKATKKAAPKKASKSKGSGY